MQALGAGHRLFFFFQAEDGIRDVAVTGVQTCALPISSYVRGARSRNWANTALYCERLEKNGRAIEWSEQLPPLGRAGETAAFGLRMNAGWPFEQFRQTTGFDLRKEWAPEMKQLTERGWGRIETDRFRLTPSGLRFADAAAEQFLRP